MYTKGEKNAIFTPNFRKSRQFQIISLEPINLFVLQIEIKLSNMASLKVENVNAKVFVNITECQNFFLSQTCGKTRKTTRSIKKFKAIF